MVRSGAIIGIGVGCGVWGVIRGAIDVEKQYGLHFIDGHQTILAPWILLLRHQQKLCGDCTSLADASTCAYEDVFADTRPTFSFIIRERLPAPSIDALSLTTMCPASARGCWVLHFPLPFNPNSNTDFIIIRHRFFGVDHLELSSHWNRHLQSLYDAIELAPQVHDHPYYIYAVSLISS